MSADLLQNVSSHLEYLGYKVTKATDKVLVAELLPSNALKPNFSVHPEESGLLFIAGFSAGKAGKIAAEKDRVGLLETINKGNLAAHVCRFTWNPDEPGIYAEAFYASLYDKHTFAAFIDTWVDEIAVFFRSQRDQLQKFVSD